MSEKCVSHNGEIIPQPQATRLMVNEGSSPAISEVNRNWYEGFKITEGGQVRETYIFSNFFFYESARTTACCPAIETSRERTPTRPAQLSQLACTQPPFETHDGKCHYPRRRGPKFPSTRGGRGTRFAAASSTNSVVFYSSDSKGCLIAPSHPNATNLLVAETLVERGACLMPE